MSFRLEFGVPAEWPLTVSEPEDVGAEPAVQILVADESPRIQRQRVDRWCAALPGMHGLTAAWIGGKVSQRLFDAACEAPDLEVLQLKWSAVRSLDALRPDSALRQLDLGASAQIESIEPLSRMRGLEQLWLENLRRIDDLSPIAALTGLTGLACCGSLDSHPRLTTFAPLAELTGLHWLDISAIRTDDRSLRPLAALTQLSILRVANWFPTEEFAYLVGRLPWLTAQFPPIVRGFGTCSRCGGHDVVQPIGLRQRRRCRACEQDAIDAFTDAFHARVAAFAAD